MRRIISCQFNIDTACVDVEYEDGFVLSICLVNLSMDGHTLKSFRASFGNNIENS